MRRRDGQLLEVMDKLPQRSTPTLNPVLAIRAARMVRGDNDTCSRPPTDLRGNPCHMRQPSLGQRYGGGYDSQSHRRPVNTPRAGDAWQIRRVHSIYWAALSGAFLSCNSANHPGSATRPFKNQDHPVLLVIVSRGGARSKGGKVNLATLSRFPTRQ